MVRAFGCGYIFFFCLLLRPVDSSPTFVVQGDVYNWAATAAATEAATPWGSGHLLEPHGGLKGEGS
jgi:hypothetical protein